MEQAVAATGPSPRASRSTSTSTPGKQSTGSDGPRRHGGFVDAAPRLHAAWKAAQERTGVTDLDSSLASATSLGGEVLAEPKAMGADWYTVLRDPAGAPFALWQKGS